MSREQDKIERTLAGCSGCFVVVIFLCVLMVFRSGLGTGTPSGTPSGTNVKRVEQRIRSIEELTFIPREEQTVKEQLMMKEWCRADAYLRYGYEEE